MTNLECAIELFASEKKRVSENLKKFKACHAYASAQAKNSSSFSAWRDKELELAGAVKETAEILELLEKASVHLEVSLFYSGLCGQEEVQKNGE